MTEAHPIFKVLREAIMSRIQPEPFKVLPLLCDELGLAALESSEGITKRQYIDARLEPIKNDEVALRSVAGLFLTDLSRAA